jgi:hypothetical protein
LIRESSCPLDRVPSPKRSGLLIPPRRALSVARSAFVIENVREPVIIAGYPCSKRGRDALIALPGLFSFTAKRALQPPSSAR